MPLRHMKFTTSTARAVDRSQFERNVGDLMGTLSVWPATWKLRFGRSLSTAVTWVSASLPSGLRSVLPGSKRILSPRRDDHAVLADLDLQLAGVGQRLELRDQLAELRGARLGLRLRLLQLLHALLGLLELAAQVRRARSRAARRPGPATRASSSSTSMRASRASTSFLCAACSLSSSALRLGQLLLLRVAVLERRVVDVLVDAAAAAPSATNVAPAMKVAVLSSVPPFAAWRRLSRPGAAENAVDDRVDVAAVERGSRPSEIPAPGSPPAARARCPSVPEAVQQRGAVLQLRAVHASRRVPSARARRRGCASAPSSRTAPSTETVTWSMRRLLLRRFGLWRPPTGDPARRASASARRGPAPPASTSTWRSGARSDRSLRAAPLGVQAQLARQVHQANRQVAELVLHLGAGRRAPRASSSSASSSSTLARGPVGVGPVEADRARLLAGAGGAQQRGALRGMPSSAPCLPFSAFSSALSLAQLASAASAFLAFASPNTCGWRRTSLATMPRATSSMPKWPSARRSSDWKTICSSRSPSSSRWSSTSPVGQRVDDLVGLLDQVGDQRLQRLLAIPGAAVGRQQPLHQADQLADLGAGLLAGQGRQVGQGDGSRRAWRVGHARQSYTRAGSPRSTVPVEPARLACYRPLP